MIKSKLYVDQLSQEGAESILLHNFKDGDFIITRRVKKQSISAVDKKRCQLFTLLIKVYGNLDSIPSHEFDLL